MYARSFLKVRLKFDKLFGWFCTSVRGRIKVLSSIRVLEKTIVRNITKMYENKNTIYSHTHSHGISVLYFRSPSGPYDLFPLSSRVPFRIVYFRYATLCRLAPGPTTVLDYYYFFFFLGFFYTLRYFFFFFVNLFPFYS